MSVVYLSAGGRFDIVGGEEASERHRCGRCLTRQEQLRNRQDSKVIWCRSTRDTAVEGQEKSVARWCQMVDVGHVQVWIATRASLGPSAGANTEYLVTLYY